MKLVDRTLAREILLPFLLGLFCLFAVLLSLYFLQGTSVLVGAAVRGLDFLRVALYLTPHFVTMGAPVALLLAVLVAVGRMAEDRELVALASAGQRPVRLLAVPAAFGACVVALATVSAVHFEPKGRRSARLQLNEIIKRNAAAEVKGGVFYEEIPEVMLYAERVDRATGSWANVLVHDERDRSAPLMLLSRHGNLDAAGGGVDLRIRLKDGEVHRMTSAAEEYAVVAFDAADVGVGVEWFLSGRNRFASAVDEMSVAELGLAAEAAQRRGESSRFFDLHLQKRFAQPLAALPFAVLAVPVASTRRRASRAAGLAVTAACAAAYYVLGRAGVALAEFGALPPWAAANLGNFVVAALAAALVVRMERGRA